MYSSSSVSKRLILIHVLAIQLLFISSKLSLNTTNAYLNLKCLDSQGKYKPGSDYQELLKKVIKMFYKNSNDKPGFALLGSDDLSAILQCRGDSYGPKCRDCFATSMAVLRKRCPWYRGRIVWYDQCLLSFSSTYATGKIDYDNIFCMSNAKKLGDKLGFASVWNTLMDNLTTLALSQVNYTQPTALYSVGETRFKGDTIYGMVQCTKDISPQACEECLVFNRLHFQDCLNDKRGARFVGTSCTFRFEFYPFINKPVEYLKS
ncbi:putative cysteine-rich repeat secretory protein 17 [Raphanus sativus]|uniref:Cysteine-rich repeat secretory protein 17 n=1 Tax=Raphanus sativus TaxID=3726 RepID=A0A6J0LKT7_RAPSA|nr:putative cysteine-rich repeat secretory protein 17 [Raphanus sativus]KAJ4894254.1 putative cysteine-rich repeat secretory protein 17 [Raphanus sativus]